MRLGPLRNARYELEAEFAAFGYPRGRSTRENPDFYSRVSELRAQYEEIGLRKWDGMFDDFKLTATLVCTWKASGPRRAKITFREIRDDGSLGDAHYYRVSRDVSWINVGNVYRIPTEVSEPTTLYLDEAKFVNSWAHPVELRDSI